MSTDEIRKHKQRKGFVRIWHATGYSLAGLKSGWHETAFRQELLCAIFLIPCSFVVGKSWLERSMLVGSVIAVLVVELLNTAIETTVDRIGAEWHLLAKRAKDMGSAAVLITLIWCASTWFAALYSYFAA